MEGHLIKEQAGFRPRKSCCRQLSQHIEDGYQRGMFTGAVFVDLSSAYHTVNHLLHIRKLYDFTQDSTLCRVIQNKLSSRRFYVLRANPDKTHVTSFHLKNPIRSTRYHIDITLSYKEHIHNTKMKVDTRNHPLNKLLNSKWGCNASTIRTTELAIFYSAAEYACPVWAGSPHASKLDPKLNDACRSITGCQRPTNIEELYLLAEIAPSDIKRDVCARVEKKKQETNASYSLHDQVSAERRLKKECFLNSARPADFPAKVIRCSK